MDQYWEAYKEDLELANDFRYLSIIGISVLGDMRKKDEREVVMICGPDVLINQEENKRGFQRAIEVAQQKGLFVFNQFHFAEAIDRIVKNTEGLSDERNRSVFVVNELYFPILETKRIDKGLFLPDWETSVGAYWKNRFFQNLGIPVEKYPEEWLDLLS